MPVPFGHHVVTRIRQQDGQYLSRPYTPVCDSFDFALHPDIPFATYATTMSLMVKVYPDGQLSPMIQKLQRGDYIQVSFPMGQIPPNFLRSPTPIGVSPDEDPSLVPCSSVFMLAGGSGITPMLRPLNWLLCDQGAIDHFRLTVHMIWFNRTVNDVPIKQELDDLRYRLPTRFSLMHVLSEHSTETLPSGFTSGCISDQICRSGLLTLHLAGKDPSTCKDHVTWLICGPLGFNRVAVQIAKQWGAPEDRVFEFKG
ncbi:unnamed protein product [Dicrocoelium dendriticum]|nr:unnamed protein product [Dicrocoelium dendriticum]